MRWAHNLKIEGSTPTGVPFSSVDKKGSPLKNASKVLVKYYSIAGLLYSDQLQVGFPNNLLLWFKKMLKAFVAHQHFFPQAYVYYVIFLKITEGRLLIGK